MLGVNVSVFLSKNERHAVEGNLLVSHSTKHINDLKQLLLKDSKITDELKSSIGLLLFNMLELTEQCVCPRLKQKPKS